MISHERPIQTARWLPLLCLAGTVLSALPTVPVSAGERKFLVILANPRKEFGGGTPPGGLPNPELIRKTYFDKTDPQIGSFAEYWEEVSYGDVRISRLDRLPEWIHLPWPIHSRQAAGAEYTELNGETGLQYGAGEAFDNTTAAVIVDTNGDDSGPFSPQDNPPYARGHRDTTPLRGFPVWMPGERFVDMDLDGAWDGLDEAMNSMDWDGDNRPDLRGPWVDLNQNGVPENPRNCIFLPDSDNDGNPDCCPDGPGRDGCEPFPDAGHCPNTVWDGPNGEEWVDCNGNLVPDSCDVAVDCDSRECRSTGWPAIHPGVCGGSQDRLPFVDNGNECAEGAANGIPDECEIDNADEDCVGADLAEGDRCLGRIVCTFFRVTLTDSAEERCEFDDEFGDGDGELDIVEPFENFVRRWTGSGWGEADPTYIQNNYPGHPDRVIAQRSARIVYGRHDPLDRIPGFDCRCSDGTPCVNAAGLFSVCPAGEHAAYDPPDAWTNSGSSHIRVSDPLTPHLQTPQPGWFAQAWVDRYGTQPPAWGDGLIRDVTRTSDSPARRRCFEATHGGTHGDGTGWVGCSDLFDPGINFVTAEICGGGANAFSFQCDAPVLPEQVNGLGQPIVLYDGLVEYDDLPSSKYHRAGDQRLGEVTSPYNDLIWGDDRGRDDPNSSTGNPDYVIPAAGPYATSVHAHYGRDAGNVLYMELLTRRTAPPFNTGNAWENDLLSSGVVRFHPFASTDGGEGLGFRDYNLDGFIDQGEVRADRTENYTNDFIVGTANDGVDSRYPFNRTRLVEDCIAILDDVIDFDDFVDTVTLDRLNCGGVYPIAVLPEHYQSSTGSNVVFASGVLSGIVLLPSGAQRQNEFTAAGGYVPVHNEDGLGDAAYLDANFPREARAPEWEPGFRPRISWNLFFNNLTHAIGADAEGGSVQTGGYDAAFAAHEYMHTWERFPDLYDYDVWQPGTIENCPIGRWDIMANGGLVHPVPILKEKPCTAWTESVDLTTLLTPGVDTVLTLKPAEFVRDRSYFYLENEDRPGERYYFWSAGLGFDAGFPGAGMLILHTDVTPPCETDADCDSVPCRAGFCDGEVSNPDAPPQQQRSGTRPTYLIVQADGEEELQACVDRGDTGDPWPGSTGATQFNYDTVPPATWYTQNSWTGLDVLDIVPDGAGSIQLSMNWVPTSIPSLRFIDPPGGESVGSTYQVRYNATDVYGGTTIRLYYIADQKVCSESGDPCAKDSDCPADEFCKYQTVIAPGESNFVGQRKKTTPGTNELSTNWNIGSIPDGRYVFFAKLIPGQGADGPERRVTTPRPGRNNAGTGKLTVSNVNIDGNTARSETWTVVCVDSQGLKWRVHSSLSQPVLNEENPDEDPYPRAMTGQAYTSPGGEVRFTIAASNECLTQSKGCFAMDDSFTFTTTGITAASRAVTIIGGQIKEDPTAVINASPMSGDPPLRVEFDGRNSYDPNGEPLQYRWNFGDGTATVSSATTSHVFQNAGTFTTVLRVTNARNSRFGETAVDVEVTNNSPSAKISATPASGSAPLQVDFSAAQSADTETPADRLIYQWNFGDGSTANNNLTPGSAFRTINHLYSKKADGTACNHASPCTFVAALTVTDEGGKSDTDTVTILAGNTHPKAVVTHTALQGPHPWEVVFNAISSFDPDGDALTVEWVWGDGSPNSIYPTTGATGATDGSVPHTYKLATGQTGGSFSTFARVRDDRGGSTTWGPVTVVVSEATVGSSDPRAIFTINPAKPELGKPFTVDASLSYDRPAGGTITSYTWAWGDQTATSTGVTATHTYTMAGTYTITLTVADAENPPKKGSASKTVIISSGGGGQEPGEGENRPPVAAFTVNPTRGYAGATVFTLDASSSTDPDGDDARLSFWWSFGDGRTGTGRVATHVYEDADPDGYVVRLTVRDEKNASMSTSQEVAVEENVGNLAPRAHIATGPRTGTAPVTLSFDGRNSFDPNGDPLTFRWEFTLGGEIADVLMGALVSKRFDQPGAYAVELEVSDGRGGVDRAGPETVTVSEPGEVPPGDGEEPDDGGGEPEPPHTIPDSASQRPLGGGFCGVGMIPALFASLTALVAMMVARRRRIM